MGIEEKNMHTFFDRIKEFIKSDSLKSESSNQLNVFHLFQNECIFILDYTQNKIIYKKGFHNVLGYRDDKITNNFIIASIHPEDAGMVNRIIKAAINYCIEHPKNSSNNLLIVKHRIKKRDGTYINIINQSSVYRTDDLGRISKALIRFTDVSDMDHTENITWTFRASNLNKKAFKKTIYKVYEGFFTKRETEVIIEIDQGHTNKQIGQILHISELTVATHRKSIFKKSNCHNSQDLILFCKEKCII